jgi:hypothetical protein
MKTNKETMLSSTLLSPVGRIMAERLMGENGVSIEKLLNFLGELETDIQSVGDKAFDLEYELSSHISSHD